MPYQSLDGLGLSLKPPAWLRNAVSEVWKGSKISIPSTTIPLPGGGSVRTPGTKPSFQDQAQNAVENIPGGWFTVAAIALGAAVLLPRLIRGR